MQIRWKTTTHSNIETGFSEAKDKEDLSVGEWETGMFVAYNLPNLIMIDLIDLWFVGYVIVMIYLHDLWLTLFVMI